MFGTPYAYVCSMKADMLENALFTMAQRPQRMIVPERTTNPIQEGQLPPGLPEFVRTKAASCYTGLSRGKIYEGIKEGWVRSVSLRKKGQKFSVRLIHLPSLISHLHTLMAQQNP
jgi:hypothetical protein